MIKGRVMMKRRREKLDTLHTHTHTHTHTFVSVELH